LRPEVLLLDEPASSLDPRSTAKLEEIIVSLKRDIAILIVTPNLQQPARVPAHAGLRPSSMSAPPIRKNRIASHFEFLAVT